MLRFAGEFVGPRVLLSSPSERPYGSAEYANRYQGQRGPTASRSFQNFHRTDVGVTEAGSAGR